MTAHHRTTSSPRPAESCPSWCDGCEQYGGNWEREADHLERTHTQKVFYFAGEVYAFGKPGTTVEMGIDVDALERVAPDWDSRTMVHKVQSPMVHLYLDTTRWDGVGQRRLKSEHAVMELTAEQLREIIGGAQAALEALEAITAGQ